MTPDQSEAVERVKQIIELIRDDACDIESPFMMSDPDLLSGLLSSVEAKAALGSNITFSPFDREAGNAVVHPDEPDGPYWTLIALGGEETQNAIGAEIVRRLNAPPEQQVESGRLREAAEPFFKLAREVINPVNGDRPWHADSQDWMVVFSFAGQSITLGDLRRAAALSPSPAQAQKPNTFEVGKPAPYFCPACQAVPQAGYCRLPGCPTSPAQAGGER